jgi:hypothetical protein
VVTLAVVAGFSEAAQRAQMQARRWASGGTRASSSALKSTCVHQQGGWGWPVARAVSMAQVLGPPHKGQRVGSTVAGSVPCASPVPDDAAGAPGSASRMSLPTTTPLPQALALAFWRQACSSGSV